MKNILHRKKGDLPLLPGVPFRLPMSEPLIWTLGYEPRTLWWNMFQKRESKRGVHTLAILNGKLRSRNYTENVLHLITHVPNSIISQIESIMFRIFFLVRACFDASFTTRLFVWKVTFIIFFPKRTQMIAKKLGHQLVSCARM